MIRTLLLGLMMLLVSTPASASTNQFIDHSFNGTYTHNTYAAIYPPNRANPNEKQYSIVVKNKAHLEVSDLKSGVVFKFNMGNTAPQDFPKAYIHHLKSGKPGIGDVVKNVTLKNAKTSQDGQEVSGTIVYELVYGNKDVFGTMSTKLSFDFSVMVGKECAEETLWSSRSNRQVKLDCIDVKTSNWDVREVSTGLGDLADKIVGITLGIAMKVTGSTDRRGTFGKVLYKAIQ